MGEWVCHDNLETAVFVDGSDIRPRPIVTTKRAAARIECDGGVCGLVRVQDPADDDGAILIFGRCQVRYLNSFWQLRLAAQLLAEDRMSSKNGGATRKGRFNLLFIRLPFRLLGVPILGRLVSVDQCHRLSSHSPAHPFISFIEIIFCRYSGVEAGDRNTPAGSKRKAVN